VVREGVGALYAHMNNKKKKERNLKVTEVNVRRGSGTSVKIS
jgi:hypothetical protein